MREDFRKYTNVVHLRTVYLSASKHIADDDIKVLEVNNSFREVNSGFQLSTSTWVSEQSQKPQNQSCPASERYPSL